jgi:hypothetical protein
VHCSRTDLLDLWRPGGGDAKLTWGRLRNLIRHLPPESATKTALRNELSDAEIKRYAQQGDPSQGQWSHLEMLVASLLDAVRHLQVTVIRVNGGKAKLPDPTPRPGVRPRGRKRPANLSQGQLDALFRRIHGARIEGRVVGASAQSVTARSSKGGTAPT